MKTRLIFHTIFTFGVVLFCIAVIPVMWTIGSRVDLWVQVFMTVIATISVFAYGYVLIDNIKRIRTLK